MIKISVSSATNLLTESSIQISSIHTCPVCGEATRLSILCKVQGYDIHLCGNCGADHVYPIPPETSQLEANDERSEGRESGGEGGYADDDAQEKQSVHQLKSILEQFGDAKGLSVLDVGCGYGTHLALAAERGWKCFGVELSEHARSVAKSRLGGNAHIVESITDLVPHQFDLILMLDVVEHLPSPQPLFFSLFALGAIVPKTRLVITTPNAGGSEARADPPKWIYLHPRSHLVLYTSEALQIVLRRLRFTSIKIEGLHPITSVPDQVAPFRDYGGLIATASGSDFAEFMRERYVPGTWSKIAEYEHLPRYALAKSLAVGKTVLDFGCGTGYGSAILATVASSVTGLDIDQGAIDWASQTHLHPQLQFHRKDDLGATLTANSFDLVTCFEMIEHVDHATQTATVASIARLLKPNGVLLISTPNPAVTKLYGENPYHLREMTLPEFLELLGAQFPHVRILEQRVRNGISFTEQHNGAELHQASLKRIGGASEAAAFVAICSSSAVPVIEPIVYFDNESDFIHDFLQRENVMNASRYEAYRLGEQFQAAVMERIEVEGRLGGVIEQVGGEVNRLNVALVAKDAAISTQASEITRLNDAHRSLDTTRASQAAELHRLHDVVVAKDVAIAAQSAEITRLNDAHRTLDVALSAQAAELHRLSDVVVLKDGAIATQASEITRLNDAHRALDEALSLQAAELHRLDDVVVAKDTAIATQASEITRLNDTHRALDVALALQAAELHRLDDVVVEKDAAIATQASEITRLNDAHRVLDAVLAAHAAELHRLSDVIVAKDDAIASQAAEINRINDAHRLLDEALSAQAAEVQRLNEVVVAKDTAIETQGGEIHRLHGECAQANHALDGTRAALLQLDAEMQALRGTKWFRLRHALTTEPWSLRKVARISYLLGALATPKVLRLRAGPSVVALKQRFLALKSPTGMPHQAASAYSVRAPKRVAQYRPRVIHIIANFMTGGSSRLVVDLLEYLGEQYEQSVVTSYIPNPPAYTELDITEYRFPEDDSVFVEHFQRVGPAFIHVHYWGDCDEPWYAKTVSAAEKLGIPVIENVNTPISPYVSPAIKRYVYVSDYVRHTFGSSQSEHVTVYPGSDFSHFDRSWRESTPEDCIGMVYRLESDKLNERAIEPFIRIVQKRPQTTVLIVGGGSLLAPFQAAVAQAGVADRFEFTGYVSYDTLPSLYRRLSVFVAPVWKESFGQVSPFAMNMRVPVIGYDVGAIGEIVDDPELIAPPADAERLAEIAVRLLDSRGLRRRVGDRQRKRAQAHFSLQAMNEAYAAIYREISQLKKASAS